MINKVIRANHDKQGHVECDKTITAIDQTYLNEILY